MGDGRKRSDPTRMGCGFQGESWLEPPCHEQAEAAAGKDVVAGVVAAHHHAIVPAGGAVAVQLPGALDEAGMQCHAPAVAPAPHEVRLEAVLQAEPGRVDGGGTVEAAGFRCVVVVIPRQADARERHDSISRRLLSVAAIARAGPIPTSSTALRSVPVEPLGFDTSAWLTRRPTSARHSDRPDNTRPGPLRART